VKLHAQGRRRPESAVRAYLTVIDRNPKAVEKALVNKSWVAQALLPVILGLRPAKLHENPGGIRLTPLFSPLGFSTLCHG
jgi:hypothetical protein